jgi:uncharacterized membrane protein (Fun14 family)
MVLDLPDATGVAGRVYSIKKVDSTTNTVTLSPSGIQKIDGAGSLVLSLQYESTQLVSDGSNWFVRGGGSSTVWVDAGDYVYLKSTTDRVTIGESTDPAVKFKVLDSTYPVSRVVRTAGANTTGLFGGLALTASTTAASADGFGSELSFELHDDGGVNSLLATIGAVRAGADNTGDLVFRPAIIGTSSEKMRLSSTGVLTLQTQQIKQVADPTENQDAATKAYVDGAVSGGGTSGWVDDGAVVRLVTATDTVSIGTAIAGAKLQVESTDSPVVRSACTGWSADTLAEALEVKVVSASDRGDGYGSLLTFGWEDDTSGEVVAGQIGAVRDGADNQNSLVFYTNNVGSVSECMRLTYSGVLTVTSAVSPVAQFTRSTGVSSRLSALAVLHKTSVNMADGHGPQMVFYIQDDTSAIEGIGYYGCVRAGADNTGDHVWRTVAAGSDAEKMRLSSAGVLTLQTQQIKNVADPTENQDAATKAYVDAATSGFAAVFNQEELTTEDISGTDTILTDTLANTPISNASVKLFLNGVLQRQGAGKVYDLPTATQIRWLQSTGVAPELSTTDWIVVEYVSLA